MSSSNSWLIALEDTIILNLEEFDGDVATLTQAELDSALQAQALKQRASIYIHGSVRSETEVGARTFYSTIEPFCAALGQGGGDSC